MKVITTHLHADFDCLASMMAAAKLHPDAVPVFSGSQEKNVRDYLAQTGFPLGARRLKGLFLPDVTDVIVVDAGAASRIGPFADLVADPFVRFTVYDHHPADTGDLAPAEAVIRQRGATSTIMVELLRERAMSVTREEATLLMLGIYEDTGALTYSSVTGHDYEAARWLLAQGADLAVVGEYLKREMTPAQVETLNALLHNLRYEWAHGVTVALATAVVPRYLGDVAGLASKIMEMENLPVLFMLVMMDDRIQLVGRSRSDALDAGAVAARMGGGGHATASSATLKEMTLPQAVDLLWKAVDEVVEPMPTAGGVMTGQVVTCPSDEPLASVEKSLTRYDIGGMPVVDADGRPVGLITRQIVEKALHHDLGASHAEEYMISEFATVTPDTPMRTLERLTLEEKQKLIPVIDADGKLVGLVTRGMVMASLYADALKEEPSDSFQGRARRHPIVRDVAGIMAERLPARIAGLLREVAACADACGCVAYAVGGFVRDLLLRIPNSDVDIVVEGDGVPFARTLAQRLGGRARVHEKFKTGVVTLADGFKVDVATARIEYYAYPAALPTVTMSAIRNDLYRRDFSVNAMAIRLNGHRPGTLIDYFGGQADLKDRVVRILHNLSFVEDPTRAFRAVRFECRYDFVMGRQTLSLLKGAVRRQLFHRLSPARLFAELKAILSEKRPVAALTRLAELELLGFIHPGLPFDLPEREMMDRLDERLAWWRLTFPGEPMASWRVRLMALLDPLPDEELLLLAQRFGGAGREIAAVEEGRHRGRMAARALATAGTITNGRLYDIVSPLPLEEALFLAVRAGDRRVAEGVTRYLTTLRHVTPLVTGADLLAAGFPPGRRMGEALATLFRAQLDGEVTTREEGLGRGGELKGEL